MTITRYRKRPVEVDTIQWTGDNEAELIAFTSNNFHALDDADRENSDDPDATATVYDKLHSTWILVYTGQHIVRGVKGEYYPIAEDVLSETYERVDDGTAATETELTPEEARSLAADLSLQLYRAQDALAFVEECSAIADREQRTITTVDVREWLKGARCGRQLAAEQHDTETTARSAADTVTRVITLHEQWVAAGPPPLGASLARWWDARLAELHNAIQPTDHTTEK